MADVIYNSFREYLGDNTIDMDNDVFKIILLADTYTPDPELDVVLADIQAHEAAGAGYTAGGGTLTSVVWTRSGAVMTFDADDFIWDPATITAAWAAIYSDTPVGDPLVCCKDFGGNKSAAAAPFRVTFHVNGIFSMT